MDKRDWEIIYTSENDIELHALELLYGELGNRILREQNIYALHTLSCSKTDGTFPRKNAVVIGTIHENPLLKKFILPEEIPSHGFRIRTADNPDQPGKQMILIAGDGPREVLYGVIVFFDDVIPQIQPQDADGICYAGKMFQEPFGKIDYADAPQSLVRSVFTWGHPIGDFREYFRNLARMKFNRVFLWNEYPPINAAEITAEAHGWGIEVFWGFSWGWSTACGQADLNNLDSLSDAVFRDWLENWSKLPGDGIYFQSFTELSEDRIGDKTIADCVTELVNKTASRILDEKPNLKIVYGLHAISVKEHLTTIAKTDPRLEILWEDCGGFPYKFCIPENPEPDDAFTRRLLEQGHSMGLVLKCQLMQQWTDFAHQSGAYIQGRNGTEMMRHDIAVTTPMWRSYDALWLQKGKRAYELVKMIQKEGGSRIEMNLAAQLNGPVRLPTALTAELFWNTNRSYDEILKRVIMRDYVLL